MRHVRSGRIGREGEGRKERARRAHPRHLQHTHHRSHVAGRISHDLTNASILGPSGRAREERDPVLGEVKSTQVMSFCEGSHGSWPPLYRAATHNHTHRRLWGGWWRIRDRSSPGPLDSVPSQKMARHVDPGHTLAIESRAAGAQRARQACARAGRAGRLPASIMSRAVATTRGGHPRRHDDFDTLARPSMTVCKRTARSNGSPACARLGRKKIMSFGQHGRRDGQSESMSRGGRSQHP